MANEKNKNFENSLKNDMELISQNLYISWNDKFLKKAGSVFSLDELFLGFKGLFKERLI